MVKKKPRPQVIILGKNYYSYDRVAEMLHTTYSNVAAKVMKGELASVRLGKFSYVSEESINTYLIR